MALGFSGSGGGVTHPLNKIKDYDCFIDEILNKSSVKYVDLFINNICNLKCKHCYVQYKEVNNSLSENEWYLALNSSLSIGAKVFGIVGKEPLLTWENSFKILNFLKMRKKSDPQIKYGLVTNSLLLNDSIIQDLVFLNIDFIDISIDGDFITNDNIRGKGTYSEILENIKKLNKSNLASKVFISYTLNGINKKSFPSLIETLYSFNIKKYLFSPYLTTSWDDNLSLSVKEYYNIVNDVLLKKYIDFNKYRNLEIHIRNDFQSIKYQNILLEKGIIDKTKLYYDVNNAVYQIYEIGRNKVIFNLQLWNPDYWYAFRISHDGYISNCFDMFYENYPERTIGNIRNQDINEILSNVKQKSIIKE